MGYPAPPRKSQRDIVGGSYLENPLYGLFWAIIDPPGPFAPSGELREFIRRYRQYPDRDHPQIVEVIREAEGDLMEALRREDEARERIPKLAAPSAGRSRCPTDDG
jgi:hypothetical protein